MALHAARRSLLAVFAHPDDETFAIAGTLAACRKAGARIALFVATDGEAGRAGGVAVRNRDELGRVRRHELLDAAGLLGVDRVYPGEWPDGGLAAADPDAVLARIVLAVREWRPEVMLTFGPEGGPNEHRDHRAISRLATAAFFLAANPTVHRDAGGRTEPWQPRRLYYTTWPPPPPGARLTVQGLPRTCRIPIGGFMDLKRRAFELYRTQHEHRERFEELLLPYEDYALAAGRPQPEAVVDDLFAGL